MRKKATDKREKKGKKEEKNSKHKKMRWAVENMQALFIII
jgi:hypothetical protein